MKNFVSKKLFIHLLIILKLFALVKILFRTILKGKILSRQNKIYIFNLFVLGQLRKKRGIQGEQSERSVRGSWGSTDVQAIRGAQL